MRLGATCIITTSPLRDSSYILQEIPTTAWFIPEGKPITSGYTLWDEEGVADETGVWYREEVPMNVACAAMRKYWQNKLDLIGIEATGIRRILKELGIMEKEENGAE